MSHHDHRGRRWPLAPLLAAGLCLVATSLPSDPLAAETLKDFIARKLKGVDLNPFDGRSAGAAQKRTRPSARGREAEVSINGHPAGRLARRPGGGEQPAVPLPRPRPFGTRGKNVKMARKDGTAEAGARPAAMPASKVRLDAAGRVQVDPNALVRERDHLKAVYLRPREIGHWDVETVRKARRDCNIVLATLNVDAAPIPSIGGPQGCGIAAPVLVRSLGLADLRPDAKLNCRFTAALYEWVRNVVQPEARKRFGQPVVAIRQLSHYACRRRGGITRGPVRISEHSFGNAIDIGAFVLADGRVVSVLKDWGAFSALFNRKAAFLKDVRDGACGYFSTVLSPQYNKAHANHFHFDLGRGGRYKICK